MARDQKPVEELSGIAKQTIEQARDAVDVYFDYLKKAISSTPSGGTELGEKLKSYAEKNVTTTHEFVKQLSQAKDFQQPGRPNLTIIFRHPADKTCHTRPVSKSENTRL